MTEPGEVVRHPQPVGAFGVPAGLLLVGADDATDADRLELVAGRIPAIWPSALDGHRLVHEGDPAAALRVFSGRDPVSTYNRWLLDPGSLPVDLVRAGLPASVAPLVDVVAYTIGLTADPPDPDVPEAAPEVRALLLAARATALLAEDPRAAAEMVLTGAQHADETAPALAGVLRGTAGTLLQGAGEPSRAAEVITRALAALGGTDLLEVRAELLFRLGSLAQEEAADRDGDGESLRRAIGSYYDALQLVTEDSAPHLWGSIQLNLAAAHLAVPMTAASDQLRVGVATQSLRACRRVFTPVATPGPWSTATLNLANALVYTPSTHPADNLVEAVGLYQEVLTAGVRDHDPLGRARVLANLGNALAHLGIFDEARADLAEARYLFEEQLDHDGVATVRGILDEIARVSVSDPDGELTDLARRAEQLSRMPQAPGVRTAGMGVRVTPSPDVAPPPRPQVTVVDPSTRPTQDRP